MKRAVLAAAISLAFSVAHANGTLPAAPKAVAGALAISKARSTAQAIGVGLGGAGGAAQGGAAHAAGGTAFSSGSPSNASATSGGNSQSISFVGTPAQQTITHNGRTYVENVPDIYAPNIYPTAPCMGSSSVGAGWVGFGMSGGTSWVDTECQLMEASRNAPTPADKVYVWCKSASAKGSPSCAAFEQQAVIAPIDSQPTRTSRRTDATLKAPGDVW